MSWWLYSTPFTAALLGWILASAALRLFFRPYQPITIAGFSVQGLIPKRQAALAAQIGKLSAAILPVKEIAEKLTHPDNVKKIMPQAEEQIDHFLRVKLVKSMPVVGMFVGDKTINTLKGLFITELEQLFPEIMQTYMARLQEDFNVEQLVAAKIAAIPPREIEHILTSMMKKELRMVKLFASSMGFIIGGIQLVIILLLR